MPSEEERKAAKEAYNKTTREAWVTRDKITHDADVIYRKAVDAAWETYLKAIADTPEA